MKCEGCTRQNCYECGYRYGMMLKEAPAQASTVQHPRRRSKRKRRLHRAMLRMVSILIFTVLMACALVHAVGRVDVPELALGHSEREPQPVVTLDVTPQAPQIEVVPLVHKEPVTKPLPEPAPEPAPKPLPVPEEPEIEEPKPEPVVENDFEPLPVAMDEALQSQINDMCNEYGVPFELIMAMCFRESSFDAAAVSVTNDYGLLQINVINHDWLRQDLGVTDFLDPIQNVECGLYILSDYIEKHGDLNLALMCYNCGAGGAANLWSQGIYSTTYSRQTIQQMEEYIAMREEG